MPHRSLSQSSFFDPEFADPTCVPEGTLPWLLARFGAELMPGWLFEGWRGEGRQGRNAWPARVLMTMLLLRWHHPGSMSRRESVRQAQHNTTWRAAMGLAIGAPTPSDKTLRRFEKFLRHRHRSSGVPHYLLFQEHWVRMCLAEGVVGKEADWVADSTPMWCYGAKLDTLRLLGDGLRSLVGRYARWTKESREQLAKDWELPIVLAKSTKGAFRIDWRDADARSQVTDSLVRDVLRVVDLVRRELQAQPLGPNQRKKLLQQCRHLLKVVTDDLETDEQGRWVVAQRTAAKRLVSITDPQAGHSRKSRSQPYKGFKVHVLGEVVSGLIASVAVTAAHVHDQQPAPRLIRRAKRLYAQLEVVLADTAYGGAELRHQVQHLEGVRLIAPPVPATTRSKTLRKEQFAVDFEQGTVT